MKKRLVKLADAFAKGIMLAKKPECHKNLDLQVQDLSSRLDEGIEAINDCVEILKQLNMNDEHAKEKILSIIKNEIRGPEAIPGGLAEGKPDSNFDPKQLEKGIAVELEHSGDKEKAKEIAKDHLSESSTYYDYLEEMENKMEKEKTALQETQMRSLVVLAEALETLGEVDSATLIQILTLPQLLSE